jgi:selenium metabolism protein YedF
MSGSRKIIDAKGLACPEPVIRTKKALEEGGFDELEIIVDNAAARDNVTRFAEFSKSAIISSREAEGLFRIVIVPGSGPIPRDTAEANQSCEEGQDVIAAKDARGAAGATVLIPSDRLGRGDDELGALLMKGFVYALAEADIPPKRIIFMNAGVRLSVASSLSLPDLKRLADKGVEILSCGTCLDFFKLKDQLAVGRISNMYEISGFLVEGRTLAL